MSLWLYCRLHTCFSVFLCSYKSTREYFNCWTFAKCFEFSPPNWLISLPTALSNFRKISGFCWLYWRDLIYFGDCKWLLILYMIIVYISKENAQRNSRCCTRLHQIPRGTCCVAMVTVWGPVPRNVPLFPSYESAFDGRSRSSSPGPEGETQLENECSTLKYLNIILCNVTSPLRMM